MPEYPEQDENVLCVVDRILGTTVFVKIEDYRKEGVIATSEVAPGRIRNIRDYVVPGKRVVCKVLRIDDKTGHIDLSLRRVSKKEQEEVLERYEKEKNALAIIKVVSGEKAEAFRESILKRDIKLADFIYKPDKNEFLSIGLSEEQADRIIKIVNERTEKNIYVKEKISVSSDAGDGVVRIRNVLNEVKSKFKESDISCISAPNFFITMSSSDYKEANKNMQFAKQIIAESAKKQGCRVILQE